VVLLVPGSVLAYSPHLRILGRFSLRITRWPSPIPNATPVTDRPVVVHHRYGLHLTRNARERVWLWERAVTCVGG